MSAPCSYSDNALVVGVQFLTKCDARPQGDHSLPRHHLIIGNGDGIGLALTRRLLARGDRVIGVSRRPLTPIDVGHAQHALDILDPRYPASLAAIIEAAEPLDSLIYCAGVGETFEAAGTACDGDTIRVNLAGLADAVNVVLPGMRLRASGRIVGVSSIGDAPSAAAPSYAGAKAGMTAYLLGLIPTAIESDSGGDSQIG